MLASLNANTNLQEDVVTNTWHFDGVTPPDFADYAVPFVAFYGALGAYLSIALNGTGTLKLYDLADPLPRSPVWDEPFSYPTAGGTTPLPTEVALCLSLKNNTSGVPIGRRRGRVYLGPFDEGENVQDGGGRPVTTLVDDVVDFGIDLSTDLGTVGAQLAIYSRTDNALRAVEQMSCDNEWDTMRSRGRKANYRKIVP